MNDKFLSIAQAAMEAFLDTIIECGSEYKEIYEKQSDFAKTAFFGHIAMSLSKEDFEGIFQGANAMEQEYLNNHKEVN